MPPADMFWGDRYGKLVDPFGHHWALATHVEDVTPEQMKERMAAMFSAAAVRVAVSGPSRGSAFGSFRLFPGLSITARHAHDDVGLEGTALMPTMTWACHPPPFSRPTQVG